MHVLARGKLGGPSRRQRDEVSSRRWRDGHTDSNFEPLSFCIKMKLLYFKAQPRRVVGVGPSTQADRERRPSLRTSSTTKKLDQSPRAAALRLREPTGASVCGGNLSFAKRKINA
jgi:hypothetical protein